MKKELSRYGLGAIDANTLPGLLRNMLRIRMFEEKIVELYPEQEMKCPVHLCIGQEAIAAGVAAHLKKEDYVFSNHRGHGHCLAKGSSMKPLFAEFYGKATGFSKGKGGSMHMIGKEVNFVGSTPLLGSVVPISSGGAYMVNSDIESIVRDVEVVIIGGGIVAVVPLFHVVGIWKTGEVLG